MKSYSAHLKQFILNSIFIVLCALIVFPFLLVTAVSVSNEMDIANLGYKLIPKGIDFSAYRYVFKNPHAILQAYKVTIIFSVLHTVFSVLLMSGLAFLLSKRNLKGKGAVSLYIYFTMLFSGGLVPTYILMANGLHLTDTIWVYVLTGLISPWYVFMMRTFFQGLPYEMTESAQVDGANEYRIFFKMILPLSKPVIAAVSLFMLLGKWNDWFTSLLYINNDDLVSLQYLLQRIMLNIQLLQQSSSLSANLNSNASQIPSESVRMAMAVVVAGPALIVFPFFQKYFVKGITVGAVKG